VYKNKVDVTRSMAGATGVAICSSKGQSCVTLSRRLHECQQWADTLFFFLVIFARIRFSITRTGS